MARTFALAALLSAAVPLPAQTPQASLESSGVYISGPARAGAMIADEGSQALLRGLETGTFSVWTSTAVLRDIRLSFELIDPHVIIAGSSIAKSVIARPEGTTIIYSHPAFTVRANIFIPLHDAAALMLLQIDAVQPLNVIVHAPGGDRVISAGPAHGKNEVVPVVIAAHGDLPAASVRALWQEKVAHFRRVRSDAIALSTSDVRLNQAFEWAKANLDQRLARFNQIDAQRLYAPYLQLNALERWVVSGEGLLQPPEDDSLAAAAGSIAQDSVGALLARAAFGIMDSDSAQQLLVELSSISFSSDWGVRSQRSGAVSSFLTGLGALAHYRQHRSWSGINLLRDAARTTFDFTRGRPPHLLSDAYYQVLPAAQARFAFEPTLFATAVVRGMLGWETDPLHRAAVLEPHMPADASEMSFTGLRVGRDRLDVSLSRENGVYNIAIHRLTEGGPLTLRVAPALPLGARVDRITVNDADVTTQSEETPHDVHAVAEVSLVDDVEIEVHYRDGIDIVANSEQVDVGETSHELRILDFYREGSDYVVVVEGVAASIYTLQMRAGMRIRAVLGADGYEQKQQRVTVRLVMPSGTGHVRKTLRIKV